jgi:hypothetical protein
VRLRDPGLLNVTPSGQGFQGQCFLSLSNLYVETWPPLRY